MNYRKIIIPLLCGIFLSCEGDRLDKTSASQSVQVNALREGIQPRVTNSVWDAGDAIGLFMKQSGTPLSETAISLNVKYITTGGASFLPYDPSENILFPFNASDVNFIGYYPFTEDLVGLHYPVDVTNQSDQSAINLLYSNNATGLNAKNPHANLVFAHQLTKIMLNINPENAATNLSGLTVRLANAGTNALFSLIDGTLSAPTGYGNISFKVAANGRFAEAIVLPATDLSAMQLVFELGDVNYLFPLSSSLSITSFEKSTRYTFNVTLNPRGTGVVVESSIIDWVDMPEEDIVLDPNDGDVPDLSKGTRNNPFTPAEARTHHGRTNVWVEGYIVGFYTTLTNIHNFVNSYENATRASIALAYDIDETDPENTFPVSIPTTPAFLRRELSLQDRPEIFKTKVVIRGDIESNIGGRMGNITDFYFP